jgi:hypothetical protein
VELFVKVIVKLIEHYDRNSLDYQGVQKTLCKGYRKPLQTKIVLRNIFSGEPVFVFRRILVTNLNTRKKNINCIKILLISKDEESSFLKGYRKSS